MRTQHNLKTSKSESFRPQQQASVPSDITVDDVHCCLTPEECLTKEQLTASKTTVIVFKTDQERDP